LKTLRGPEVRRWRYTAGLRDLSTSSSTIRRNTWRLSSRNAGSSGQSRTRFSRRSSVDRRISMILGEWCFKTTQSLRCGSGHRGCPVDHLLGRRIPNFRIIQRPACALHDMRASVDLEFRSKEKPRLNHRKVPAGSGPYFAPKSFRINRYKSSIQ
jgi:hypothetical protein